MTQAESHFQMPHLALSRTQTEVRELRGDKPSTSPISNRSLHHPASSVRANESGAPCRRGRRGEAEIRRPCSAGDVS